MNEIPSLTTTRLIMRPLTSDDAESLHQIMAEPEVLHFFPNPAAPSLEQVSKMIAGQERHWHEHHYGWWGVTLRQTGRLIGWCGLQFLPETEETEVAYLLAKSCWGQGLATEAARATLDFGFETLQLSRIIAIVHPDNLGSQRVAEKAGLAFLDRARYFQMECVRYVTTAASYQSSAPDSMWPIRPCQ